MAKTIQDRGSISVDEMTAQIIDARAKERRQMQATIDALVAALEEIKSAADVYNEDGYAGSLVRIEKIADAALALARKGG